MAQVGPLKPGQRALLALLRERSGRTVNEDEILAATGWKPTTWRVYSRNGVLDPFITPVTKGVFKVVARDDVDEREFHRALSQSPLLRHVGAPCRVPLARALVKKARDNMILALEIYNRPSLENRLDAFSMLFCTAWEQLLKAEIIETDGEETIFRARKAGRRRESISLQECLERRMDAADLVRKNLERIEELRHGATHLLMAPLQAPLSRLFQAGVINFASRFKLLAADPLLPRSSVGLLSLVGDDATIEATDLKKLYGDLAAEDIANLAGELSKQIEQTNDHRFAIVVEYQLALTKTEKHGDILLTTAADASNAGLIVIKPMALERTHPFRAAEVLREVVMRTSTAFNHHDLQAVLHKEKWKASNNEFHYLQMNPDTPKYSEKAVEYVVSRVKDHPEYLPKARADLAAHMRAGRAKQSTAVSVGKK